MYEWLVARKLTELGNDCIGVFDRERGSARRLLLDRSVVPAFAATAIMAQPAPGGTAVASQWWAPG